MQALGPNTGTSEGVQMGRTIALAVALYTAAVSTSFAQKKYAQGVSDTEIKIGQTMPYSGPLSSYAILGRTHQAYFRMINEKGGVNGRKINLISVDDAFSPPKTVEATRRLVEQEEIWFTFGSSGTAGQSAVQKYLASKKVPQLFLSTGASKWNNPKEFPWTTPILHLYSTEGEAHAKYLLGVKPEAKVGILMQNDDFGKDFVAGFKRGLGDKSKTMIVKEAAFEVTEPTLDQQIIALRHSGADVLFNVSLGKQTAQAIRKVSEMNWQPMHIVVSTSAGKPILEAAGIDNAKGIISATAYKQAGSPAFAEDPDVVAYKAFMQKYLPNEDATNEIGFISYSWAILLTEILESMGDELTAEAIVAKVTNMKNMPSPALLPGITYNTTPTDYAPIKHLRLQSFNGATWDKIQDVSVE
jgi:ABC-type branched-subunit amino acid transport system substrate-binding protein